MLNETGTYAIHYDAITSDAAGSTPPVTSTLNLEQDGVKLQGTTSSATIATADQAATLASNAIVNVTTAPSTITLVASNTSADFTETNISIIKLD